MRRAARLPLEQLAPYLLDVPSTPVPLDWTTVFGNDAPIEIEVGFGKGMFLVASGQSRPDVNFLGIEIEKQYQLYVAGRLAKRRLRNVKLACCDARRFLRDHVGTASVQAVHVYFPDPWWKKRHHKRRVFTEEFAADCARVLRRGGRLHVASDVEDYFTLITEMLERRPELRRLSAPAAAAPRHDLDYLSNFERKYRKSGKAIWRAVFERLNGAT